MTYTCPEVNYIWHSDNELAIKAHQAWHKIQKEQQQNQEREGSD